jgi:hypothetical protein
MAIDTAKRSSRGMAALPLVLGLAAFAGAFVLFKKPERSRVTGKSGQAWDVELEGSSGDTRTYAVYAPAGTLGLSKPMFVVRYQQTGSDMAHRPLLAAGKSAQGPLVDTAITDFGLQAPAGVVPLI